MNTLLNATLLLACLFVSGHAQFACAASPPNPCPALAVTDTKGAVATINYFSIPSLMPIYVEELYEWQLSLKFGGYMQLIYDSGIPGASRNILTYTASVRDLESRVRVINVDQNVIKAAFQCSAPGCIKEHSYRSAERWPRLFGQNFGGDKW
jgi:hypothetical protein